MYKLMKKRRTTKELFALLKEKVLAFCKNQPKIPSAEINHTDIIFPGELMFRKKGEKIDYGDPSISKGELIEMSKYLEYDFPLQTY